MIHMHDDDQGIVVVGYGTIGGLSGRVAARL